MAHFVDAKGNRISGKTIAMTHGHTIQIGLWGFLEGAGGPALTVLAGYQVSLKPLRDDGLVRVYQCFGSAPGVTKVEAINSTQAVWDWIEMVVSEEVKKKTPRYGLFPDDVISAAVLSQQKWGVPASVTLAQWAVESAWGSAMPDGSNNPFGIKAATGQPYVEATTKEVVRGETITVRAKFRKFASMAEAFDQHGRLLAANPKYARAMASADDPDAFANALTGVYATAPNYGAVLIIFMQRYNLYKYNAQ